MYAHLYVHKCRHHIKNLCIATGISLVEQYATVDKYWIAGCFDPKVFVNCFQVRSVVRDAVYLYVRMKKGDDVTIFCVSKKVIWLVTLQKQKHSLLCVCVVNWKGSEWSQHGSLMERAPIGLKTDRDHLVKDNLGCYCLKTFEISSDSVSLCVIACSRCSMHHC